MFYTEGIRTDIISQLLALPFWQRYWNQVSVTVVGSVGAGFADEHSDLDVLVLIPEAFSAELYEACWQAVDTGRIRILNPRARLFKEFPLTYLDGIDGHYQLIEFEPIEQKVSEYDDVTRWIYQNSIALHDPVGRLEALRKVLDEHRPKLINRHGLEY